MAGHKRCAEVPEHAVCSTSERREVRSARVGSPVETTGTLMDFADVNPATAASDSPPPRLSQPDLAEPDAAAHHLFPNPVAPRTDPTRRETMELLDIGTRLHDQLFNSRDGLGEHPIFRERPTLQKPDRLETGLRDRPDSSRLHVHQSRRSIQEGSFDVAAYTEDLLAHLCYDPTVDHIVTSVVARSSIKRIELLSAPDFMTGGTAPSKLVLQIFYDKTTVRLSEDHAAQPAEGSPLGSFLHDLRRDLTRGTSSQPPSSPPAPPTWTSFSQRLTWMPSWSVEAGSSPPPAGAASSQLLRTSRYLAPLEDERVPLRSIVRSR